MNEQQAFETIDAPRRWWFRRGLAIWAAVMLTVQLALVVAGKLPTGMTDPFTTLAWIFGAVILAFFGNNGAVEWIAQRSLKK